MNRNEHRTILYAASACILVAFSAPFTVAAEEFPTTKLRLSGFGDRLPAKSSEVRKAIEKQPFGIVSINERSIALKVRTTKTGDAVLRAHVEVFDFYLVPVTVSVIALDGSAVKSFQVDLSLPAGRVNNDDVWLVDVFPRLEVVASRLTGNVEIAVSGSLEVDVAAAVLSPATGNANIGGNTKVTYQYNPVFQSFAAAFDQAGAIWSFTKIADEIKAGPIDLRLLVAVKKSGRVAAEKSVFLTTRVKANFGRRIFFGRSAEATGRIEVNF